MPETQDSLCEWADETFGPVGTVFRIVARINEEMSELLKVVAYTDGPKIIEEASDTAIIALRLAQRMSYKVDIAQIDRVAEEYDRQQPDVSMEFLGAAANFKLAFIFTVLDDDEIWSPIIFELMIFLARICKKCGSTLQEGIDAKMLINHSRIWEADGTGHGYHK